MRVIQALQSNERPRRMRPVEAWRIDRTIGALSMHNHGTAVLDRPAEATAPAEALLPALDISTFALDLEPAKCTDDAATALAPRNGDVRDLAYEELAVALNASGVRPQRFRSADPAQLMEWAAQGLSLLGIDRIRHYVRRTRYIHCQINDQGTIPAQHRAEYARMWPRNPKAVQSCHNAAWRLTFSRPTGPLSAPLSRSGL